MIRCGWCNGNDLLTEYHDNEWGVPLHDEHKLFEFLLLEGAQAGLSWLTILKRREHYRLALNQFDPQKIARYTPAKIERLLTNPGLIRNRLKIASLVTNARAFLEVQAEFGRFDQYIWRFVDGAPIINRWKNSSENPATSKASDAMSKDLKRRGFTFVGSTICYAFMQATGMVNDHSVNCFRYHEVMPCQNQTYSNVL